MTHCPPPNMKGTNMKYAWIIDIANPEDRDADGTKGPAGIDPELEKLLDEGGGLPFKMYDDDDNLYYCGRLVGEDATGFEPLDDFGTPNAGASYIKLYNEKTSTFETL